MAFTASDGSKHTNHSSYKSREARVGKKAPAAKPQTSPDPEDGQQEDGAEGAQDGTAMLQEHGPAMQVAIDHDHENNMHRVHVLHQDGTEHETEHGSPAEAHRFAADCAGGM